MIDQTFTQDDLDTRDPKALEEAGWFRAIKTTPTLLRWIDGGFRCLTREGYIDIDDEEHGGAYLAIDAEGFPYPIAATVFDATYKRLLEPDAGAEDIAAKPHDAGVAFHPPVYEPMYVQLHEIVAAKQEGVLSDNEAHDAALALIRKSGLGFAVSSATAHVEPAEAPTE